MALELGAGLDLVRRMPHAEYIRWRAFMKWREVMRKHAADVDRARNGV